MRPRAPSLRRFADPFTGHLTVTRAPRHVPAEAYVTLPAALTIPADPLRAVPRGRFTLDDYSYDDSGLCHHEFGSCCIKSLRVA